MTIPDIIKNIEKALQDLCYVQSLYRIFGIQESEVPDHFKLTRRLQELREQYRNLLTAAKRSRKRAIIANEEVVINSLQQMLATIEKNKLTWKNGPVKVLCSDSKLLEFDRQIERNGYIYFSKSDVEKYFDFSLVVPFWNSIPSYTGVLLGNGLAFASPEYELFRSMCWFSDEATRTKHLLDVFEKQTDYTSAGEREYSTTRSVNRLMCVYAVISSFLVVEAYLNSQAHLCLNDCSRQLSEEQRLFLSEKSKGKDGKTRQKFVAIQDKLHEWVRIISPRGETLEKGDKLFQQFMKLKSFRDSIVHLSETKIQTYNAVGLEIAAAAVRTVVEVIRKIDQCVSQGASGPQQAWWLREPGKDGYFHLPEKFDLPSPLEEEWISP